MTKASAFWLYLGLLSLVFLKYRKRIIQLTKTAGSRQQHLVGGMNRSAVHLALNCKWDCIDMTMLNNLVIAIFYYKLSAHNCGRIGFGFLFGTKKIQRGPNRNQDDAQKSKNNENPKPHKNQGQNKFCHWFVCRSLKDAQQISPANNQRAHKACQRAKNYQAPQSHQPPARHS
jgi:hypothetical protein